MPSHRPAADADDLSRKITPDATWRRAENREIAHMAGADLPIERIQPDRSYTHPRLSGSGNGFRQVRDAQNVGTTITVIMESEHADGDQARDQDDCSDLCP